MEHQHHDASMPNVLEFETSENVKERCAKENAGNGDLNSPAPTPVILKRVSRTIEPGSALKTPRTIIIQKHSVPAGASQSQAVSSGSLGKRKVTAPTRQLQFMCENGRVVAAPLAVGASDIASTIPKERVRQATTPQSGASAVTAPVKHPEAASGAATAARPIVSTASNVVGDDEKTPPSVRLVPEAQQLDGQRDQAKWIITLQDTSQSAGAVTTGDQHIAIASTAEGEATVKAGDIVSSPVAMEPAKTKSTIRAVPHLPRGIHKTSTTHETPTLVLNTSESLVQSSGTAAVLDAVESAAGSAAAVSHVVFEPDGRAVGALVPAPGQDGEPAQQQVVLAGRRGEPPVVLTVDGSVLGGGDSSPLVWQVDEASDTVTLLVNRPEKEVVYELSDGELLELWERDSSGQDRHVATVTEISLVDIRAVCEECGCVISHHMVGLLARDDGTEYGYRCRQCQFVHSDVDVMAKHMDSHRSVADSQCRFCSKGLHTFKPKLTQTYTCHACKKVFGTRGDMIRHREVHPLKMRFPCELCDKAFPMRVQLEVHTRTHLGHKPYSCDVCPASFTQPSHLINHRRTHTGERPYPCQHCGRAFVQQGHLRAHERTHTGERPYKCDFCGRGFRQSGQLTAHKKLHEGEEPVKFRRRHGEPITPDDVTCQVCKKAFKLPKDVKRHMLIHGEGTFECKTCGRKFKRADHLSRHQLQHDKPPGKRRRRRRYAQIYGQAENPDPGLLQLDGVIDAVLEGPEGHENTGAAFRRKQDIKPEEGDGESSYNNVGPKQTVANYVDDDVKEEDDLGSDVLSRNTRISLAPKDALWSQPDASEDEQWQQEERQNTRQPMGSEPLSRRSRLFQTPFADDGVDEEMEMLAEALRERSALRKRRRSREATSAVDSTGKLEPGDWETMEADESGGQQEAETSRRKDENWARGRREDVGGKRRRSRSGRAMRPELIEEIEYDADVTEGTRGGIDEQFTQSLKEVRVEGRARRTSHRSMAGSWAANVGVSLTRTSHRGGKR